MDQQKLIQLITETVKETIEQSSGSFQRLHKTDIPIAVSNRHVHLSSEDLEWLFGRNYELTKLKELSQPGQFAAKETVTIIGPKGKLPNVRILGPSRGKTQVEISLTDGFIIGTQPPVKLSGDINGTPGVIIQGPRGQLKIKEGLICAARHIHMHPTDADAFGVTNGDIVKIGVDGKRSIIFDKTLIRVSPKYRLEMHIDFDEANAANLKSGTIGKLIRTELS
ncbi:phosphate propanoyltransferase [Evansella tamaricis]|uniref:Phosphate propanoyltransferase n=1 Tax=Evansella tamaricis TaxID=2069301 RepID=A0ABS6JE56_9BACI|nr:phosphate propanoyltransferase [Evansella tamaricis]MBU9711961.1 phosphate propanoyltransferase [Evansella tamaricis]